MRSIRFKITAITIAAILTSILTVFFACSYTIQAENDRSSVEMMNLISQNAQKAMEKYMVSIEQSVEMAANIACDTLDGVMLVECGVAGSNAGQGGQTPEQAAELDAYLAGYCDRVQEAFSSVAGHTQGVVTYYYCISPDISQNEHGFFFSRVGKTGFDEREPLDARTLDPADIGHTTWYYTPIERGRPSWVGPYTAHFLGEMITYSYLVPIYKAGALIGVLGMDIPFETLTSLLSSIRVYDTGFACLFDVEEHVLYHPELEYGSALELADLSVSSDIFRRETSGDELIRYTAHGEKRQLSFVTLLNGMKLVVTAPVSEIKASWTRLAGMILLITIAVTVLYALVLLFVLTIITRPLKRLTEASQRLAAGDYDVELDYNRPDEVGTLTTAFTQMRDHMKLYIDDLNRRILTDALTGLPNMRYFFKLAETERERLVDCGKRPAMLYFNLIGLKFYNRQYGFEEGDRLIRDVAGILARRYGRECVSRFSQDHFTAITDEARMEDEMLEVFEECRGANGGNSLPVRVGIYAYRLGEVNVSIACDRAKYACDLHRDTYASGYYFFDTAMLKQVQKQRYVISRLDQALEENWIRVCYQPIIRAANGKVCDEEALSRWINPDGSMLSPGDFIPVLEDARLIYKLDLYVLDRVLEKMKAQERGGLQVVPQSVNLSRADFDACDIVEEIRKRVDNAGIPREKLTIEVTESMVGSDYDFMKEQVERFQALGFKVWMDDFGSGYSSLDVLQDIHFDLIKFDMRFMQRFGAGNKSKIILTELIRMAIGLGIETVAEGVETKEQVSFLQEVGCTKLQGYYFGKAIPLEEIVERNRKGSQIGYENQDETGYYTTIGRINLYDIASVTSDGENIGNFFDTLPMAVIESDGKSMQIVRCNKSYRDFMVRAFGGIEVSRMVEKDAMEGGMGAPFAEAMEQCREEGTRVFIHEKLPDGATIHAMLRHIAVNPATGIFACVAVVLGIADAQYQDGASDSGVKRLET